MLLLYFEEYCLPNSPKDVFNGYDSEIPRLIVLDGVSELNTSEIRSWIQKDDALMGINPIQSLWLLGKCKSGEEQPVLLSDDKMIFKEPLIRIVGRRRSTLYHLCRTRLTMKLSLASLIDITQDHRRPVAVRVLQDRDTFKGYVLIEPNLSKGISCDIPPSDEVKILIEFSVESSHVEKPTPKPSTTNSFSRFVPSASVNELTNKQDRKRERDPRGSFIGTLLPFFGQYYATPDWSQYPSPLPYSLSGDTGFKTVIWNSVPDDRRPEMWAVLSGAAPVAVSRQNLYDDHHSLTFGFEGLQLDTIRHPPYFSGMPPYMFVSLTDEGVAQSKKLLCMLSQNFPESQFVPSLPAVVARLLICLDEKMAYIAALQLLKKSSSSSITFMPSDRPPLWMATSRRQRSIVLKAFLGVARQRCPAVLEKFKSKNVDILEVVGSWMDSQFVNTLNPRIAHRVFDLFLVSGAKAHVHIAVALLKCLENSLLQSERPLSTLQKEVSTVDEDSLLKMASLIYTDRRTLDKFVALTEDIDLVIPDRVTDGLYLRPLSQTPSKILNLYSKWETLWLWCPRTWLHSDMRLLYSTWRDGVSIHTLYNSCEGHDDPCILIISAVETTRSKGENNIVVGALLPEGPRLSGSQQYGSSQASVFSIGSKEENIWRASPESARNGVMWGFPDRFTIGSQPAITLGDHLTTLTSDESATFGSPLFTEGVASVVQVELWGFIV